jgi:hypothetical protein
MVTNLTMLAAVALAAAVAGVARAAAPPAWFAPIAAYYHHNPKIGPRYDFASLYSGHWRATRKGTR